MANNYIPAHGEKGLVTGLTGVFHILENFPFARNEKSI